ncbi:hypothetical protein QF001_005360 [Paraburkholderia youngii]|uniref:hypothetical protein n=1 Tax=Paraburkholderia youngii TaxID=2782701 RepID=UPI003D1CEFF1
MLNSLDALTSGSNSCGSYSMTASCRQSPDQTGSLVSTPPSRSSTSLKQNDVGTRQWTNMLVSAEQHAVEQLRVHFDEFMDVAKRVDLDEVVRARCAYEALYEVAKSVVNLDGIRISAESQADMFARAVVDRAARVLRLTPEEAHQAQALNEWALTGLPADPPLSAETAVQLAERLLAASLGSRGR